MILRTIAIAWLLGASHALAQDAEPGATDETEAPPEGDEADAQARQLFTNGATLYEEGRYEQAITAFRAAYELSGKHDLLLNIANAQERLGETAAAVTTLNDYRIYADAEMQVTLERRIRVLEERIEQQEEEAEAARVAEPTPAPVAPTPEPPPSVATTQRRSNPIKWVVLGTGAALAGGFGATTVISYGQGQSARDANDQASYDSARSLNTVSGVLTGLGGGLLVAGIALPAKRSVSVAPMGTGIRFGMRF